MKQIFISDLHLDESRDDLTRAFLKFLAEKASDADELYILGDFFDVWLGDDHETAFNSQVIAALRDLSADVYLMHGNRDFLLGSKFCRAAGAILLPEYTVIDTPAGPALLLHGDSLCTLDTAYMAARHQLRAPAFQMEFLAKSLEERSEFARSLRGKSSEHTRETAADIMDVTAEEVPKAMHEAGVNLMIHGHTHRPAVHQVELGESTGQRYVLGDWHDSMKYLRIESDSPILEHYLFK